MRRWSLHGRARTEVSNIGVPATGREYREKLREGYEKNLESTGS